MRLYCARHKILWLGLWAGLLCFSAVSPSQSNEAPGQTEKANPSNQGPWKLINTGLFAIGLGWFLVKYSPRFFNARSADIQKAIKDATGLKIEADFRYSAVDKKMAGLGDEVNRLREQGRIEMEREHERLERETQQEIERIRTNAGNEIEALRKDGSNRVQLHTAQLALGLAERRLQERFAQSGEPGNLVDDFTGAVERGSNN